MRTMVATVKGVKKIIKENGGIIVMNVYQIGQIKPVINVD
jgi:hypothetical protein